MMEKNTMIFIQNGLGGAERVTIEIMKMLIADGWRIDAVIVCTSYNTDISIMESFIPEMCLISKIVLKNEMSVLRQMFTEIRRCRPSVVFCSAIHINQRLLLLAPFFRKVRFVMRNENYLYTLPKWKQLTLALTYRFADDIICQTEEMEAEMIGLKLNPKKIHTIYNPLDGERINCLAKEESPFTDTAITRYVSVGRLAPQKGFDLLIESFSKVSRETSESMLYIVGDTNYNGGAVYKSLLRQINELELTDKVKFTGFQNNPYKYIANADVFVLSSRYEGLPNVLIEGQLLGTPAAAFKCIPIIERIIKDGTNGYLAEKEDVDSLTSAMLKARKLGRIDMTYTPAKPEDFINLFNDTINH